MLSNSKNEDSKDLKIKIKKYLKSIHLIDYFLIIGYEEIYIQKKIVKNVQNKDISNNNKYQCEEYPVVLSSINSDFREEIIDDEDIIKYIFPEPPNIIFNKGDNLGIDIKEKNIIFSKVDNNSNNIGYAFTFYEYLNMPNRTKIYIPKTFVIISQYPYFITFNHICKEIYNLFHSNNIQIPIEIQLYNIINYIPIPIGKRLDTTLFPFYDLNTINKCQSNEEFISLENQKICSLTQIKGYNKPQINISELFELIPIELIIEVYLKLLTGHIISIFYNDIEILNIVIFLFNYFLYPLSYKNNVHSYSKNQYDNDNNKIINKEEYIYGFITDYNNINKEKENNIFDSNYYLDINNKCINIKSSNNLDDNRKRLNEYIKNILNECSNENDNNNINDKTLDGNIKKLIFNLNKIKENIKRYGPKNIYNFYELNDEKQLENNNKLIFESFYKFNLYISSHYYQYYLNNIENKDSDDEKIFYNLFSNSIYSKILNDYKTDYLLNEHPYNIIKIIFENILINKNLNYNNNKLNEVLNNLDIIEFFYKGKENDKSEAVTFLDFYKYYVNYDLQQYFYDIINNEFVDCINKNDKQNIKYLYKYKIINLDKNILLKYNYLLEQMVLEDKNKCFPYITNNLLTSFDTIYKIKDINNTFEQFLINNKIINTIDIIKMSILNIVALSTSGHKLIYFTDSIYEIMKQINISLYKFITIILSIALKIFIKEKNQNLFIYEKYFNIFNFVVDNNLVTVNNELNIIHKKILDFIDSIKDKKNEEAEGSDYKLIKDADNKKLYTLEPKLKEKEALTIISNASFNGNLKNNKITFKTKFLKDKTFNLNDVFSPLKVYNQLNKMIDEYNKNLDFSKINKEEYKKLIIHLIYYCNLYPQDFKGITKFLIFCLKTEH